LAAELGVPAKPTVSTASPSSGESARVSAAAAGDAPLGHGRGRGRGATLPAWAMAAAEGVICGAASAPRG
jgi:hypothetical protein